MAQTGSVTGQAVAEVVSDGDAPVVRGEAPEAVVVAVGATDIELQAVSKANRRIANSHRSWKEGCMETFPFKGNAAIGQVYHIYTIGFAWVPLPFLALAPVAVLPEYQNQGIGSLLIREGIKKCEELGYKAIIVLGHANYYPRFGFKPARESGLILPFDAPDEAFMV